MTRESKKVLLLAPTMSRDSSRTKWLAPNIGVYRIAGFLQKHGHQVDCYDHGLYLAGGTSVSLEGKVAEKEWDFIGFSVLEESLPNDISNMHMAAETRPGAVIVAGGIEAQYNYQTILDKSPCRICVIGEGERPMLDIVDGAPLHEIPGIVFKNAARVQTEDEFWEVSEAMRYEEIPYETYWRHYRSLYEGMTSHENLQKIHTVRIFTRNYCPVGCKFCVSTNQLSDAAGVKRAKVVDIIDDRLVSLIERIQKTQPQVKTVYFTDDDFCANLLKVKYFCKKIIEKKIDISFICFARADKLDEETIKLMAQAGFRVVNMGLESFSKEVWAEYGKRYNYDRVIRNLDLLKESGILPFTSVILCGPEATLDDIELTAGKLLEYLRDGKLEAGVNISVQPYRGSFYHDEYHDMEVEMIPIPNTKHKIRKEYFIRCRDPEARELQYRFLEHYLGLIEKEHEDERVIHATSSAQAQLKLELILELIAEIRAERSNPEKLAQKKNAVDLVERGVKAVHRLQKYSSGSAL